MNLYKLNELENIVRKAIAERKQRLLEDFPIDKYIELLDRQPISFDYHDMAEEIKTYCSKIIQFSNGSTLQLYHKLLIFSLIRRSYVKLETLNLTEEIKSLYLKYYERIIEQGTINNDDFYSHSVIAFCKDLALCRLKMIPVGALLMERGDLSKRFLFKKGVSQFLRGLSIHISDLMSSGSYYILHATLVPVHPVLPNSMRMDGKKHTSVLRIC